jgi:transposase-like protein
MISAVSAQGQMRFMLTKARVTAKVFIEFLKRLLVNASAPVFLIVDGHPTHKAKCVQRFVESQQGKYRRALQHSSNLLMRPLAAHWHEGLGHLYLKSGKNEEARSELVAAIELYRIMDMAFWLPKAESALAEVSGSA